MFSVLLSLLFRKSCWVAQGGACLYFRCMFCGWLVFIPGAILNLRLTPFFVYSLPRSPAVCILWMYGRNPFRTTLKPWLKPELVGNYVGESNHFRDWVVPNRISQPSTVFPAPWGRGMCGRSEKVGSFGTESLFDVLQLKSLVRSFGTRMLGCSPAQG